MIKPITSDKILENKIIEFFNKLPSIKLLLRFGSKLVNGNDLLSDIDLFILVEDTLELQNKLNELKPSMILDYDCRSVLYFEMSEGYYEVKKVDMKISNNIDDYFKFVEHIKDFTNAILIDNIGIGKITNERVYKTTLEKIKYHVNRFIEAFENCSVSNQSSDQYRFLFHQTIALQHLYTLEYMANNYLKYNYLPKQLTNSIKGENKDILKKNLDPNSNLKEGRKTRLNLINKFEIVLKHIFDVYNTKLDYNKIMKFLNTLLIRDWIWNIRDLADINPEMLKDNVLIRSSSLSFYNDESILHQLLINFNVKSIIDLRHKKEIELNPYNHQSLIYHNIPIGAKHIKPHRLKYTEIGIDPFFYEYFPRHYKEEIKEIFMKIIITPKPVILHCYAGKDRTGIIVSMIQKLVGLSDEEIILDYVSSRSDTKQEKIKVTLRLIDEIGGIKQYFEYVGLDLEKIELLKNMFKR